MWTFWVNKQWTDKEGEKNKWQEWKWYAPVPWALPGLLPEGNSLCSAQPHFNTLGEAIPHAVVSQLKPEAPEITLVPSFCSGSSIMQSLGLAAKDSPPLGAWGGGCLLSCPLHPCFSLLIFLPRPALAAPSSCSQLSLTPPICQAQWSGPACACSTEGDAALLTHPPLFFSLPFFFFFFLQWSSFKIKITWKGKATEIKI